MNQQAMLKRARQLQQEMIQTQKEIDETEFTASVGPVTVVMKGSKELVRVMKIGHQLMPDFTTLSNCFYFDHIFL